ncbi:hypothetical protein BDY24DRAFT_415936 [Mrakia frigida]|uniref:uncharacterized protein n=1 Tax=Mrakia frigida TaxID=29902 RepID=UPI003FCC0660
MSGSTTFTPPLSTHTIIPIPRSSTPSQVVITFKASSSLPERTDLPVPQLWTNLGSSGSEWRAIPFLPLDVESSVPSHEQAANWPILSLSSSSPRPLLPPVLPRFATLSFDVDESFAGKEFGYTYRMQYPDQGIEWLGSDGSNGSFRFELEGGGEPLLAGRWNEDSKLSDGAKKGDKIEKSWLGGEGEVGIRIGEGWEGFGLSFDEGAIPSAHLLSTSTTTPLSTIILQPTPSNPPIHHVGLPSTPIILSADPSSYFLASGSAIKVKHSVDGFAPKAAFLSLPTDASSSSPPSLPAGLALLPSSGETTALLSTKTKDIFLHSTTITPPFPISVDLSKAASSFGGGRKSTTSLAVYSELGGSVVQLDVEGEGEGGFLVDQLEGSLSTLKVVELSRVTGSDLLVGSIDPPSTSHSSQPDEDVASAIKPVSSFVENVSETASEPGESVNGLEEEVNDSPDEGHARVLGGEAEIERRGVFPAFLRWWASLWQAVLSLFGVVQKEAKTVKFDDEAEVIPDAPTESTPLLAHNHSHSPSTTSTLSPSSSSSSATLTPTLFAPAGLVGGILISSPSRKTPSLVLKARLASSSKKEEWTELKLKGKLETVSNSQGGNWWKGIVVNGGEGLRGEEDWAVWVGEERREEEEEA